MDIKCPDQIKQWMEFPFDFINPEYKAGLDFSMESLKLANQCLGDLKAGMKDWPKDNFQQIFCENRQNLVKQRITPHFQTTDHPITTNLLPGDEL